MRAHLTQPEMILIQPEVLKAKQLTQLQSTHSKKNVNF